MYTSCDKYSNSVFSDVPYLDVTAVLVDTEKAVVVNVVNRHETNAITTDILLQSGTFQGIAKISELNGKDLTARGTKTEPAVTVTTKEIKFRENTIGYSFPAHSLTQIIIPIK